MATTMMKLGDTLYLEKDLSVYDVKLGDLVKLKSTWCLVQGWEWSQKDGIVDLEIVKDGRVLTLSMPDGVTIRNARKAAIENKEPIFTFEGKDFYPINVRVGDLQPNDAFQIAGEWYFVEVVHSNPIFDREVRLRNVTDNLPILISVDSDQVYTVGRA